jgi:hypothetical protein
MLWGHIQQYTFPGPPYGKFGPPLVMYTCLYIHTLPQGGSSKAVLWGGLKEIHLNYTTIKACSEDATASKAPYPVLMNILVLK